MDVENILKIRVVWTTGVRVFNGIWLSYIFLASQWKNWLKLFGLYCSLDVNDKSKYNHFICISQKYSIFKSNIPNLLCLLFEPVYHGTRKQCSAISLRCSSSVSLEEHTWLATAHLFSSSFRFVFTIRRFIEYFDIQYVSSTVSIKIEMMKSYSPVWSIFTIQLKSKWMLNCSRSDSHFCLSFKLSVSSWNQPRSTVQSLWFKWYLACLWSHRPFSNWIG